MASASNEASQGICNGSLFFLSSLCFCMWGIFILLQPLIFIASFKTVCSAVNILFAFHGLYQKWDTRCIKKKKLANCMSTLPYAVSPSTIGSLRYSGRLWLSSSSKRTFKLNGLAIAVRTWKEKKWRRKEWSTNGKDGNKKWKGRSTG